ncbi:MAG: aminotransferase class III-fold pyridoxal phosphate-dependent enzyme, partial [Lachnospiraceae bacterium]|nr:aminotransferase class III-fold pyridoxal phosphate-dependent enzyme [Lachnospiraceae bacterium]
MKQEEIMQRADSYLLRVYNRFPVVFDHGEGMYLYDIEGKAYLDFAAGIGVSAFGYGDEEYEKALIDQVKKLIHVSNLFYHDGLAEAAEAVCKASGMDKVFFTNSGAEAIEGAIKTAKKYGTLRDGHSGHEIIAMNQAFHGRTVGALSVTGTEHYREPFYPLMGGVRFADFNDLSSVEAQISENTIAVLLEPVQGEGGVTPATEEFIRGVRRLCDAHGLLLIFDEIQCGCGRTGNMFAWQGFGVKPDILTT